MKARTIYSLSKLVTEQISSGQNWSIIKRVITIVITEDIFVPEGEKYHHQFRHRTEDGIEFTDLVEINTLDLSKLPPDDNSTDLWNWMKFIKSDDEEVMDMLATRSPQMRKAVGVLKELSADEQTRMLHESREMARRDFESRVEEVDNKWQGVLAEADKKWQGVLEDKDAELAGKDVELAGKDAELAGKDAELARQAALIAQLQSQINKAT